MKKWSVLGAPNIGELEELLNSLEGVDSKIFSILPRTGSQGRITSYAVVSYKET